jgi:hypothetical protein
VKAGRRSPGQEKPYGAPIVSRHHMRLRIQPAAGLPQSPPSVFFNAPAASGRAFTEIQGNRRYPLARHRFFLKGVKNPLQHAVFCPAIDSDADGAPGAEGFRERPPFAAVFADRDESLKRPAVIDFYISPLFGEKADYFFPLFLG